MYAIGFHTGGHAILFITAMSFCILIRQDPDLREYDTTTLYTYKKHKVDIASLDDMLKTNTSLNFINKVATAESCTDIRIFDWPQILHVINTTGLVTPTFLSSPPPSLPSPYIVSKILPGNPSCIVNYHWTNIPDLQITGVSLPQPYLCTPATYTVKLIFPGPPGTPTPGIETTLLQLVISPNPAPSSPPGDMVATFSHTAQTLGTGFTPRGTEYQTCKNARTHLALTLNRFTNCTTENSQFCSCVYLFTQPLLNTSFVLPKKTQNTSDAPDNTEILKQSIEQCMKLRRSRDIFDKSNTMLGKHSQSQLLLLISMVLLLNAIYHLMHNFLSPETINKNIMWLAPVFVASYLLPWAFALAAGSISTGVAWFEITILCIGCVLVGMYYEVFFLCLNDGANSASPSYSDKIKPVVHPVTFGIVYGSLTSFILIHRGVVSIETLTVEIIKSIAATCIYTKIVIFFSRSDSPTNHKFMVDRAQFLAIVLLTLISADVLFTPYGDKTEFHIIWLAPLVWVILSVAEHVVYQQFNMGYFVSDNASKADTTKTVDIRRNIAFTFLQLFLFFITSYLCTQYYTFKNMHRNDMGNTSPLEFKYLLQNDYSLPGYVREGIN